MLHLYPHAGYKLMMLLHQILSILSSNMLLASYLSVLDTHRSQPARSKDKGADTKGSEPKGNKGAG